MRYVVPADAVSWVDYDESCPFPIQNVPFGAFRPDNASLARPCIAIGEYVVDLLRLQEEGLIQTVPLTECDRPLDPLLKAGSGELSRLRRQMVDLLHEDATELQDNIDLQGEAFFALDSVELTLGYTIRAYVDFYSGIHHASNVGRMFRPDQPPLLPNYRWIPIGYNGRASTVDIATEVRRPMVQMKGPGEEPPTFGPTRELDFELEMGFVLAGEPMSPIAPADAEASMAGLTIVNDWSARDAQRWEYQPLGPFLAKTFATSVSPWLVTLDALEPFRVDGMTQDPAPLEYLRGATKAQFNVQLEVWLQTARSTQPQRICVSTMQNLYWSMAQQLAHQTSNGTVVESGDLYASGTISGEAPGTFGSMLELSWRGQTPLTIEETGETRTFLEDGDTVTMIAFAQGDGFRIGFGETKGTVVSA